MYYAETVRGDVPRLEYLTPQGGWSPNWARRAQYHTASHAMRAVDLYAERQEKAGEVNPARHVYIQNERADRAGGVSVITLRAMFRDEGRRVGGGYIGRAILRAQAKPARPLTAGALRHG